MAQNITLMGASYSDVPAVTLPKTGGGTALFTDVTGTTATADEILQGYGAYGADGTWMDGRAVAGSGSAVTVVDTLDSHGGTIRTITAVSLAGDTVSAAHLELGYKAHDALGNAITGQLLPSGHTVNLQAKTNISPTTVSQTIEPDEGYDALSSVQIDAVPSGSAGTPTATKGTVSNHSVSVTPSVTNTTGYITGSTKTGTAVTVSASELVSGNKAITQNGDNIDVTEYATVSVNVSGGGGSSGIQVNSGAERVGNNGYISSGITLTVAESGTYKVTWMAWRSSSQGTMGTNLYVNDTAGTNQQTFTNTYGQHIELTGQSYSAGDVLTLYATSGSNSRYIWVGNLIIEKT